MRRSARRRRCKEKRRKRREAEEIFFSLMALKAELHFRQRALMRELQKDLFPVQPMPLPDVLYYQPPPSQEKEPEADPYVQHLIKKWEKLLG